MLRRRDASSLAELSADRRGSPQVNPLAIYVVALLVVYHSQVPQHVLNGTLVPPNPCAIARLCFEERLARLEVAFATGRNAEVVRRVCVFRGNWESAGVSRAHCDIPQVQYSLEIAHTTLAPQMSPQEPESVQSAGQPKAEMRLALSRLQFRAVRRLSCSTSMRSSQLAWSAPCSSGAASSTSAMK